MTLMTLQYIVIIIGIIVIGINGITLVMMWHALATGSYRQYIRERHAEQGTQHDKLMKEVREGIDRDFKSRQG